MLTIRRQASDQGACLVPGLQGFFEMKGVGCVANDIQQLFSMRAGAHCEDGNHARLFFLLA